MPAVQRSLLYLLAFMALVFQVLLEFPFKTLVSIGATVLSASGILSSKKAVAPSQVMDLIGYQSSCHSSMRKKSYVSAVSHLLVILIGGFTTFL